MARGRSQPHRSSDKRRPIRSNDQKSYTNVYTTESYNEIMNKLMDSDVSLGSVPSERRAKAKKTKNVVERKPSRDGSSVKRRLKSQSPSNKIAEVESEYVEEGENRKVASTSRSDSKERGQYRTENKSSSSQTEYEYHLVLQPMESEVSSISDFFSIYSTFLQNNSYKNIEPTKKEHSPEVVSAAEAAVTLLSGGGSLDSVVKTVNSIMNKESTKDQRDEKSQHEQRDSQHRQRDNNDSTYSIASWPKARRNAVQMKRELGKDGTSGVSSNFPPSGKGDKVRKCSETENVYFSNGKKVYKSHQQLQVEERIKHTESRTCKTYPERQTHSWAVVAVCAASSVFASGGTRKAAQAASAAVLTAASRDSELDGVKAAAEVSAAVLAEGCHQPSAAAAAVAVLKACQRLRDLSNQGGTAEVITRSSSEKSSSGKRKVQIAEEVSVAVFEKEKDPSNAAAAAVVEICERLKISSAGGTTGVAAASRRKSSGSKRSNQSVEKTEKEKCADSIRLDEKRDDKKEIKIQNDQKPECVTDAKESSSQQEQHEPVPPKPTATSSSNLNQNAEDIKKFLLKQKLKQEKKERRLEFFERFHQAVGSCIQEQFQCTANAIKRTVSLFSPVQDGNIAKKDKDEQEMSEAKFTLKSCCAFPCGTPTISFSLSKT